METEDYVSVEQAILLKEKGFPQPDSVKGNMFYCEIPFYESPNHDSGEKYSEGELLDDSMLEEEDYQNHGIMFFAYCPTQSQVQKWLRKEKHFNLWVEGTRIRTEYPYTWNSTSGWQYEDEGDELPYITSKEWFKTYEDALSAGITRALGLI